MVASEPSPSGDPGDTAFDHPSSGKRTKPGGGRLICLARGRLRNARLFFGSARTPNDVDGPPQMHQQPEDHIAAVMAISPQRLDPGEALLGGLQQAFRPRRIGALGTGDLDGEQMALGVNEQVPFASPDFFSPHRSLFLGHEPHSF